MLNLAKELVSWGISVVPVPQRQKSPAIAWKEYQSRLATESELVRWFSKENGIGIICGAVSGNLVCLDFDSEEAYEAFIQSLTPEQSVIVESLPLAQSHKGKHLFFRATMTTASTKLSLRNRTWFGRRFAVQRQIGGNTPDVAPVRFCPVLDTSPD